MNDDAILKPSVIIAILVLTHITIFFIGFDISFSKYEQISTQGCKGIQGVI